MYVYNMQTKLKCYHWNYTSVGVFNWDFSTLDITLKFQTFSPKYPQSMTPGYFASEL
jgi:hypothetical protein